MRGLLAVLLVGCTLSSSRPGDPDDPFGPPGSDDGCRSDTSCSSGQVCTRSGDCLPPMQVREVHVTWLVNGKTPDDATCSPHPNLRLDIYPKDESDRVDYSPVPCVAGRFTVDKLPTTFDRVRLGPARGGEGTATGTLDAAGELVLDLPF